VQVSQRQILDPAVIRRRNALIAFQSFVEAQINAGAPPKGLEQSFAELLQVKPSLWSMVKSGKRGIGDKLARQMEHLLDKPVGWMDEERETPGLTQAEQAFLALALKTWRANNAEGRKRLKVLLREHAHAE
jgi:hypothetical protein